MHGLRGGSVKTWRKQDDAQFFWPQRWLPFDPGLRDVRIHSFGYNSDWTDRKDSILNIHDFGRSLLGEMITSPDLRKDASVNILKGKFLQAALLTEADSNCTHRPLNGGSGDQKGLEGSNVDIGIDLLVSRRTF